MASTKTFLVTGANRGIGLELARQLSQSGHVIATARDPSKATTLASIPNVTVISMDVSSASSISAAGAEVTKLAPNGIDELWNNAARHSAKFKVADEGEVDAEGWVNELRVNVVGQTLVTRAMLGGLKKGSEKKVVFISSNAGSLEAIKGTDNGCSYCSSKAALNMSIKFWHHELSKEGMMVTGIHPGWVRTDMGGDSAHISVEESVTGMLKVVAELDAKSELKPRVWDGSILPW